MALLDFQFTVLLVSRAVLEVNAPVFPDDLQEYVERYFLKLFIEQSVQVCRTGRVGGIKGFPNYFVILVDG